MYENLLASFNINHERLLFIAFPTICFSLVILFKQLRRKFPIQVNCWFCNQYTALHYNERNSFTCPSCHQYNGFTEDGDYNKVIPEQRDELLNHIVTPRKLRSGGATNGLCQICNNNQQLKIYQLANFVPLHEDNYDVEIEHFQKQLEKAYRLCPACNYTVKNTIARRNCTLLGKQIEEIRKSGKTLLNRSTTAKQKAIGFKKYIFCSLACATLYIMYKSKRDWFVLVEEYSLELTCAIAGSLFTVIFNRVTSPRPTQTPLRTTKKIKIEKLSPEKKSTSRVSTGSYASQSDMSGADLSYASFNSPLNSTVRSDDGGSICSELDRITSNINSRAHNEMVEDYRSNVASPHTLRNSFVLRKSPSAPSMYSSFATKPPLNLTFQQLHLTAQPSSLPTITSKRPILSPAKFRNPWTGKPWDVEVSSRSSSQSSGVYSRATSICGDEVASVTSEQNLFKNLSNSLSLHTCANNFSNVDRIGASRNFY